MGKNEEIQKKIDALFQYRVVLNENEKVLFDILLAYANEVALSIDSPGMLPNSQRC